MTTGVGALPPAHMAVRWRIALLLCLITTINYVDRIAFSVATPTLRDRFGFTNADIGDFGLAFLAAYALGQLFGGRIVDRFGVKRTYGFAVMAWSLACIAHALGQGVRSFSLARVALGLGEAVNFPAAFKAVAEWFPRVERSLAVGVVTLGVGFGSMITPPLAGWLIITLGWQWAFIVPGTLGLLWLVLWQRAYHAPEAHPRLGGAERELIIAERDQAPGAPRPVLALLSLPETWVLMASRFVADGAFYFILFFLPTYLIDERGFVLRDIALFAWLPFAFADLGSFAGGWVSTRLMRRGWSLARARTLTMWVGAVLAVAALPAAYADSAWLCFALICATLFAIQFKQANLFTLPSDLFPARDVATVWGMFGAAGSVGGALFSAFSGRLADAVGFAPVFVIVAILHIVSAGIAMLAIRRLVRVRQV
ncbi:MAG: MFS transporter [Pseudomonadota bacterium]